MRTTDKKKSGRMRRIGGALTVAILGLACLVAVTVRSADPPLSVAAESDGPLRVYVVVVDGMSPGEVGLLTPTLSELKNSGTWYEQARAVFPAETLPNHVAMATGMLPARNGIIGNQDWKPNPGGFQRQYMEHPGFLDADTIVTRLERACDTRNGVSTATIMSKSYLYGIFRGEPWSYNQLDNAARGGVTGDIIEEPPAGDDPHPQRQADFHWHPRAGFRGTGAGYVSNPSDHAVDEATMDTFLTWMREQPADLPQFAFVNLGNVDRAGHADATAGTTLGASTPFRQSAIEDADQQLRLLVDELRNTGAWDDTVLMLLSDHGMDYGPYDNRVDMTSALQNAGYAPGSGGDGEFWTVGGGGSGLVWVNSKHKIGAMAKVLAGVEGVEFIATRELVPGGLGNGVPNFTHKQVGFDHAKAPDIQVFVKKNWRIDEPHHGNPLPGNHGHAATEHSMLMVTGGHPLLREGHRSIGGPSVDNPSNGSFAPPADGPGNLSVAPTVAALYGIGEPEGGYDRSFLGDAFDPGALPHALCGSSAAGGGQDGGGGGEPPRGDQNAETPELTTTIAARKGVVRQGERAQLEGHVRSSSAGDCDGPYRVAVYQRLLGSRSPRPRVLATALRAGSDGRWSMKLRPTRNAEYVAVALPTQKCRAGGPVAARVLVRVRVLLNRIGSCGRNSSVSGRVTPAQPGSQVLLRRRNGRRYQTIARAKLDRSSAFRLPLPACTGAYQVVWRRQGVQNESGSQAFRL